MAEASVLGVPDQRWGAVGKGVRRAPASNAVNGQAAAEGSARRHPRLRERPEATTQSGSRG
ncbi:hypothetical protein [Acrocarpospora catenulata]|uniref:hypothetical protein n=1 Tax=Acrocarpospora catenulata TaxID=2836182 RepID=UPI00355709EE